MEDNYAHIKVRFKDQRKYVFVRSDGGTTGLRIHAGVWAGEANPITLARELLADNEDVEAVRVIDSKNSRLWFAKGSPVPPKPEFPFHEYTYLTSIRNNRGTFDVKDDDGRWGHVTEEIYGKCVNEAKRAGLLTDRLTVRGSICSIQTSGLRFNQQMNQYVGED